MPSKQLILGIETSCDETGAAVLSKVGSRIKILSNIVSSSASLQAKYGGIIPEQAAREQIKSIIPVIEEALLSAFPNYQPLISNPPIDAIAITYGPGLIGSLLVGVEAAKTLSWVFNKPLIPINHLLGHFYANWIDRGSSLHGSLPKFPFVGLLVSGGHSDLVLFKDHQTYQYLGGTRDDAAGECFDKCARLLGLPYPGGPQISRLAQQGNPKVHKLPRPMLDSKDLDFSFSGLKTAVSNLLHPGGVAGAGGPPLSTHSERSEQGHRMREVTDRTPAELSNLSASIEATIVDLLVRKTIQAIHITKVEHLIVAGGVAANSNLKQELERKCKELGVTLLIPPASLCTDNGAMVAARAFFEKPLKDPLTLEANPNLSLETLD